jgi:hypothetical protein
VPVWWCRVCEHVLQTEDGDWFWVADGEVFDHDCPGTPIDLIAERERLIAEQGRLLALIAEQHTARSKQEAVISRLFKSHVLLYKHKD